MAAAAAVISTLQQNARPLSDELGLPAEFISGVPCLDWQSKKITLDAKLAEKRLGSMDGKSICQGTAAGGANYVGPAVAQPIQNVFNSGSHSVYGLLMNTCAKSSALFAALSEPPYENNADYSYGYINFVMQTIPTPEDFQTWKRKRWKRKGWSQCYRFSTPDATNEPILETVQAEIPKEIAKILPVVAAALSEEFEQAKETFDGFAVDDFYFTTTSFSP